MRKRLLRGLILIFGTGANAQWLNYLTPGTPRTKDGKPNLAAKARKAPNGKRICLGSGMPGAVCVETGEWQHLIPGTNV